MPLERRLSRRVSVDASFVRPGLIGGREFYLRNLLSDLEPARKRGVDFELLHPAAPPWNRLPTPETHRFLRSSLHHLSSARSSGRPDAWWFPDYFLPPGLPRGANTLTVIHDVQYLSQPQYFSPVRARWLRACHQWALEASKWVVVVSETVRLELLEGFGAGYADKVVALHNPIHPGRFTVDRSSLPGAPITFLALSAGFAHKNLSALLWAARTLLDTRAPDFRLIIAGQSARGLGLGAGRGTVDLQALCRELRLERVVQFTGHLEDAALSQVFSRTHYFLHPSLFEGFGMPPVEALLAGIPTLVSDLAVLREVTLGKANLYVPLGPRAGQGSQSNADLWAEAMRACLEREVNAQVSPELQANLRRRYAPGEVLERYLALSFGSSVL